jgi:hypothetical protein
VLISVPHSKLLSAHDCKVAPREVNTNSTRAVFVGSATAGANRPSHTGANCHECLRTRVHLSGTRPQTTERLLRCKQQSPPRFPYSRRAPALPTG